MANHRLYDLKKENIAKQEELVAYNAFYKDYLVRFEAVKFYIENKFLIGDDDLAKIPPSIGGSGVKLDFNLDDLKKNRLLEKQLQLKEWEIDEVIRFFPDDFEFFEKSMNLVKKANSDISLANGNNLKFIPFLLPVFGSDLENIIDRGNYIILKVNPQSRLVATATGWVDKVISYESKNSSVVLRHGFAIKTYYEGLKSVSVKEQQEISKGEVIGVSDDDFVVYRIKIGNQFVPPLSYIISSK